MGIVLTMVSSVRGKLKGKTSLFQAYRCRVNVRLNYTCNFVSFLHGLFEFSQQVQQQKRDKLHRQYMLNLLKSKKDFLTVFIDPHDSGLAS